MDELETELATANRLLDKIYLRILGYYELYDDTPEGLIRQILDWLEE